MSYYLVYTEYGLDYTDVKVDEFSTLSELQERRKQLEHRQETQRKTQYGYGVTIEYAFLGQQLDMGTIA